MKFALQTEFVTDLRHTRLRDPRPCTCSCYTLEGVSFSAQQDMCAAGTRAHVNRIGNHGTLIHVCKNMLPALMHMPRFASCTRVPALIVISHAYLRRLRVQVFAAATLIRSSMSRSRCKSASAAGAYNHQPSMRTQPHIFS
eukprot:5440536-Pleurochrysis_carterae.AAC.2